MNMSEINNIAEKDGEKELNNNNIIKAILERSKKEC
jgi:hypothetical protein